MQPPIWKGNTKYIGGKIVGKSCKGRTQEILKDLCGETQNFAKDPFRDGILQGPDRLVTCQPNSIGYGRNNMQGGLSSMSKG